MIGACDSEEYKELTIKNTALKLAVRPDYGGRISSLKFHGQDILRTPEDDSDGIWGSLVWPAPQSEWVWPPPVGLETDPFDVISQDESSIVVRSRPNAYYSLQLTKKYELIDEKSLHMTYTLHNHGDAPVKVAIWENTRVRYKGVVKWQTGEPVDNQIEKLDQSGSVSILTLGGHHQKEKLFINSEGGWVSYEWNGIRFTKRFQKLNKQTVAPEQMPIEIYFDPEIGFTEIEEHGAYVDIQPGQSQIFEVKWFVEEID